MNFEDTIRLKCLSLKATVSGQTGADLFDHIQESDGLPSTRNICAIIHVKLFDKVENITNLLNISKRQFVELALIEAIEKASYVINDVNPLELAEESQ